MDNFGFENDAIAKLIWLRCCSLREIICLLVASIDFHTCHPKNVKINS